METRNGELARVSECEGRRGRAREVNGAYIMHLAGSYNSPDGTAHIKVYNSH